MPVSDIVDLFSRIIDAHSPCDLGRLLGLDDAEQEFRSSISQDWRRGGAETFFSVVRVSGFAVSKEFVIKACVPFSPATPVLSVLSNWLKRRQIIESSGVLVPRLYGVAEGAFVEDFVPFASQDLSKGQWFPAMIEDVFRFAHCLAARKFHALAPFDDLRSDGQRIYAVDFGEDLGEPNATEAPLDYVQMARTWFQRRGIDITQDSAESI